MKKLIAILLVLVMALSVTALAEGENSFAADNENIKYIGRWLKNDNGYMEGSFECQVIISFNGTSLKFQKGSSGSVWASLDGGEYAEYALSPSGKLAKDLSNLEQGEHTLEIVARAQSSFPVISGIVLDDGATLLPVEDKPVIEFIGDSILEGYVVGNNSVLNSYGHITAQLMGFYRNIVAFGGITVCPNYGNPDNQGMYNRYFMQKEYNATQPISDKWDTSAFVPDYIVINLGTNDPDSMGMMVTTWYGMFLKELRKCYSDTVIFVMTPFNGDHAQNIEAAFNQAKDDKMFFIASHLWQIPGGTDNLHPDNEAHKLAAEKLKDAINDVILRAPENTPLATENVQVTPSPEPNGEDNGFNLLYLIPVGAAVIIAIIAISIALKKKKKENKL